MKNEPEVIEAEVIEPESREIMLSVDFTPASIEANFEDLAKYVSEMVVPYLNVTEEVAEGIETKDLKSFRSWLAKMSAALNNERKRIKAAYKEPLNRFEAQCKEIDAIILEPRNRIDSIIKQREADAKAARREHLEQCYMEFAADNGHADLPEVVPFDKVLDPKWLNASFGEVKGEGLLFEKVMSIITDWNTLRENLQDTLQFYAEAEREFFATLSITEAVAKNKQLVEEQQAINALKAQADEAKQYQHQEPSTTAQDEQVPVEVYEADNKAYTPPTEPVQTFTLEIQCTESMLPVIKQFFMDWGIHGVIKGRK